jgi:DNA-binding MarR family transcriptional regulator
MTTPEEDRVLASLLRRLLTSIDDLARSCGQSAASLIRVLSKLEWGGHVIVYRDAAGLSASSSTPES